MWFIVLHCSLYCTYIRIQYIYIYIYIILLFIYVYYIHKMCFTVCSRVRVPVYTCLCMCNTCVYVCVCVFVFTFHQIDSNKTYKHVSLARWSSTRHRIDNRKLLIAYDNNDWLSLIPTYRHATLIRFIILFLSNFFYTRSWYREILFEPRDEYATFLKFLELRI